MIGDLRDGITEYLGFLLGERSTVLRIGERETICIHVRELIYRRDNAQGRWCDASDRKYEIDHIQPWSAGGPSTTSNLQLLCVDCNQAKSNRTWSMCARPPIVTACGQCHSLVEHGTTRAWCARCSTYTSVSATHIETSERFYADHECRTTWGLAQRPSPYFIPQLLEVFYGRFEQFASIKVDFQLTKDEFDAELKQQHREAARAELDARRPAS